MGASCCVCSPTVLRWLFGIEIWDKSFAPEQTCKIAILKRSVTFYYLHFECEIAVAIKIRDLVAEINGSE